MGFESHNLLFANIVTDKKGSFASLRQQLLNHSEIADVCQSDYIPYILPGGNELSWEGGYPDQKVFVRYSNISHDFVPTFNMKMAYGRNFSREFPADYSKCLINETAVRVFGWKDPIGRQMLINDRTYQIIGVIKDYVVFSVHNPTEPHLYRLVPDTIVSDRVYSVRFTPGHEERAKEIVKKEFETFFPDDAFEFANIENLIQNENAVREWKHIMKVNVAFAILSVIVSSIGLFGLILFYTRHKLKEVGMRKVLGFSFAQLYYTLSSGFIKLMLISILFAWPAAYYTYKALPGANKYPIQIWEFLLATLLIFIVAVATISYQIIKAVRVNPVEILKEE
jgi:putative ABC transport system permease protein